MSAARNLKLDLARASRAWAPSRSSMNAWAAAALGRRGAGREIAVRVVAENESRQLNKQWRSKDKPTNVLSFPMAEAGELESAPMLGDIVLAYEICAAEAAAMNVAIETHAAHLMVHGTLHLLGYDHETSEADAELMEETERQALAAIGIADPYKVTEVQS